MLYTLGAYGFSLGPNTIILMKSWQNHTTYDPRRCKLIGYMLIGLLVNKYDKPSKRNDAYYGFHMRPGIVLELSMLS